MAAESAAKRLFRVVAYLGCDMRNAFVAALQCLRPQR